MHSGLESITSGMEHSLTCKLRHFDCLHKKKALKNAASREAWFIKMFTALLEFLTGHPEPH